MNKTIKTMKRRINPVSSYIISILLCMTMFLKIELYSITGFHVTTTTIVRKISPSGFFQPTTTTAKNWNGNDYNYNYDSSIVGRRHNNKIVVPKTTARLTGGRIKSLTSRSTSSTSLHMFMGSDGGLLGIGTPEALTILLVGYFVLGPSDLFKLVKEIGKFIQNIRTLGTDLSKTFETNMNDVVQIEELRKAQRELNDAFSFRRSINVDSESEAFSVQAGSAQQNMAVAEQAAAATTTAGAASTIEVDEKGFAAAAAVSSSNTNKQKRKIRRRVMKRPEPIPQDLEMPSPAMPTTTTSADTTNTGIMSPQELAEIEKEFDQYTGASTTDTIKNWFDEIDDKATAVPAASGKQPLVTSTSPTAAVPQDRGVVTTNPLDSYNERTRFQQQLSGNWNQQVLTNEDKLEPIATVMNKIALLEQEKKAAMARLEEEFQKRTQIETEYYNQQRKLLEEAGRQIQDQAFGLTTSSKSSSSSSTSKS